MLYNLKISVEDYGTLKEKAHGQTGMEDSFIHTS